MDLRKMIQIVHYLLSKSAYRLNYTKLLKILYLADREAYSNWDSSITKDEYWSLPQGPVLSGLYDLIRGSSGDRFAQTQWNSFFMKDEYDLVALHKIALPIDELSQRELEVLNRIEAKYRHWNYLQLIDLLHDRSKYPEWEDPGESSNPLPPERILRALGRTEAEIREILAEDRAFQVEEDYLQKCCV